MLPKTLTRVHTYTHRDQLLDTHMHTHAHTHTHTYTCTHAHTHTRAYTHTHLHTHTQTHAYIYPRDTRLVDMRPCTVVGLRFRTYSIRTIHANISHHWHQTGMRPLTAAGLKFRTHTRSHRVYTNFWPMIQNWIHESYHRNRWSHIFKFLHITQLSYKGIFHFYRDSAINKSPIAVWVATISRLLKSPRLFRRI